MLKVWAIDEGSVVQPKMPQITIEGPLAFQQLQETPILNLTNYPSLIATNALRFKVACQGKTIIEMGTRRAQGEDGAITGSLYSYIGGCDYTSNVYCNYEYGIPIVGTMGHSYVTSVEGLDTIKEENVILNGVNLKEVALKYRKELGYENTHEGELAAFLMFVKQFPNSFTAQVDSYDTMESGNKNAILAFLARQEAEKNRPAGEPPYNCTSIRLDSGDLAALSNSTRELFRKVDQKLGTTFADDVKIVVSNDINEDYLREQKDLEHNIDTFGIGTNQITCQKQPALGMVCKQMAIEDQAKLKFSEEISKMTLPFRKNLYMVKTDKETIGVICTKDQHLQNKEQSLNIAEFTETGEASHSTITIQESWLMNNLVLDLSNSVNYKEKTPQELKANVIKQMDLYWNVVNDCSILKVVFSNEFMSVLLKEREELLHLIGK